MDLPKALQDEEEEGEGEGQGNSPEGAGDADQEESEPMEEGEGEGEGQGRLDTTWGDTSFSEDGRGQSARGVAEGGGSNSMEVQMNWNICKYLPEEGSCQTSFQVMCVYVCVCVYVHVCACMYSVCS